MGVGVCEDNVVAVGTACVSVPTTFDETSDTLSGEVCGLHAPSMRTMIRNMKVVHVGFNKSPVLLWLVLPVCGFSSLPEKTQCRLEVGGNNRRSWTWRDYYKTEEWLIP